MEPGVIKKLDEIVVNRIAAGEIIQRPANALKEMLENSLDAASSNIQVIVKDGGLKYLQIQDNGTGIRKEDLNIVCERFTTSKLKTYEDLSTIKTYGFRGEALASISHVAHLTIQTKTKHEKCGFRASYEDGNLKGEILPCAGNQGTQITVEDLFYNVPQRRQGLNDGKKEFQNVYDVICKYAVHNSNVGFALKKFGESNTLRTTPSSTPIEAIRIIYGNQLAKEIISINLDNDLLKFKSKIYLTKVSYSQKKSTYLFFINNRLIDNAAIRTCIEESYLIYLPKGTHPFVYLSLEIDPQNVDVNVHPTKHEVHFLHEDEIIEKIKFAIEKVFVDGNESRVFYTQSKLPGASSPDAKCEESSNTSKQTNEEKIFSKDLVRTDSKMQKIEKYFSTTVTTPVSLEDFNTSQTLVEFSSRKLNKIRIETKLFSVLKLRKKIERNRHRSLRKALADLTFVGVVDKKRALIQHEKILYLCNTQKLTEELFYQILIYDFGNFDTFTINENGLSINELAKVYLNSEDSEWTQEDGDKNELATKVEDFLVQNREILAKYFGINITKDGNLITLPVLLENHIPNLAYLPRYLVRLATEVNWNDEEECFDSFSRETALYYAEIMFSTLESEFKRKTEFVLYPAIKQYLIPPVTFAIDKSILEITTLPQLYKVFERC